MAYNIGDAFFSIGADLNPLKQGLSEADGLMQGFFDRMNKGVSAGQGAWSSFGSLIKSTLVAALEWKVVTVVFDDLADALKGVADGMIGLNARLEQSRLGWGYLLKNVDQANTLLFALQQLAARAPYLFQEFETNARKLMAAGEPARQLIPLIQDIGNALTGVGNTSSSSFEAVTNAFARMVGTARVHARDLNSLVQAGIPAWDILRQQTGMTTSQIQEGLRNGTIAAQTFIKAFEDFSKKNFGDAMQQQSHTFLGSLTTIKDQMMIFGSTAFKPVFDAIRNLTDRIANFVSSDAFMDWASKIAAAFAVAIQEVSRFTGGFEGALNTVLNVAESVGKAIYSALQWINPFARHSPSLVESVQEGTGQIADMFDAMAQHVQASITMTGNALERFKAATASGIAAVNARTDQETANSLSVLGPDAPSAYLQAVAEMRQYEQEAANLDNQVKQQQQVVDDYRQRIEAVTSSFDAQERALKLAERGLRSYDDAVKTAQAHEADLKAVTDAHREALDQLQQQLSHAQDVESDLSNTQIQGTAAYDDRQFGIGQEQAQAQLDLLHAQRADAARRAALQPAIDAETAAVDQATAAVEAHQEAVNQAKQRYDDLKNSLSAAQQDLKQWTDAPLVGTRAFQHELQDLDTQTNKLQLDLLNLKIANPNADQNAQALRDQLKQIDDAAEKARTRLQQLQDESALVGTANMSPELKAALAQAQDQYSALLGAHEQVTGQLTNADAPINQMQALEAQIAALQDQSQKVKLTEALQLDPLRQQLADLADTSKEVTFDQAAAGIQNAQERIAALTPQVDAANTAWQGEEDALKGAQQALKDHQDRLAALKKDYDTVSPAVKTLQDRLAALQDEAEEVKLDEQLQLGPLERDLERIKNPIKELPFDELAHKLKDAHDAVTNLKNQMVPLQAQVDADAKAEKDAQKAVEAATKARDDARDAIDRQKQALQDLKDDTLGPLQDGEKAEQTRLEHLRTAYQLVADKARDYKSALDEAIAAAKEAQRQQTDDLTQGYGDTSGLDAFLKPWKDKLDAWNKQFEQSKKTISDWVHGVEGDVMAFLAPVVPIFDKIGDVFNTSINPALDWIGKFVDTHHRQIIEFLEGFAGGFVAINLALGAFGVLAAGIGAAIGFILSPIGILSLAVGGLYLAWKEDWGNIREITEGVYNWIKGTLVPWIETTGFPHVKEAVTSALDPTRTGSAGWAFKTFKNLIQNDVWPYLKTDFLEDLEKTFNRVFGNATDDATKNANYMYGSHGTGESWKGNVTQALDDVRTFLKGPWYQDWNDIQTKAVNPADALRSFLMRDWHDDIIWAAVTTMNGIIIAINGAQHALNAMVQGARDAINWLAGQFSLTPPFKDPYQAPPDVPQIPMPQFSSNPTPEHTGKPGGKGAASEAETQAPDALHGVTFHADTTTGTQTAETSGDTTPGEDPGFFGKIYGLIQHGVDWLWHHALEAVGFAEPNDTSTMGKVLSGVWKTVSGWAVRKIGEMIAPFQTDLSPLTGGVANAVHLMGLDGAVITQHFSDQEFYNGAWHLHEGTDFAIAEGTPIHALFPGYVSAGGKTAWSSVAGHWMIIKQQPESGYAAFYGHMRDAPLFTSQDDVPPGATIGYIGHTGIATGPHLHFQLGRILDRNRIEWVDAEKELPMLQQRAQQPQPDQTPHPAGGYFVGTTGAAKAWIAQALSAGGFPGDWSMPASIIALAESGDDPRARNLRDSNAQAGYPSRGLMQTIPQTYNQWRRGMARPYVPPYGVDGAGRDLTPDPGDIYDPIENIIASLYYILRGKGKPSPWDLIGVQNVLKTGNLRNYVGYAQGGWLNEEVWGLGMMTGTVYSFAEGNNPEYIFNPAQGGTYNTTHGPTHIEIVNQVDARGTGLTEDAVQRAIRNGTRDGIAEGLRAAGRDVATKVKMR